MNTEETPDISNLEALISSIETDDQVYRWFTFLVTQPELSSRLKPIAPLNEAYTALTKTITRLRILLAVILILLLMLITTKNYPYLLACLLFFIPLKNLFRTKKQCVVTISKYMLTQDFHPSELPKKTLYQICEIYSRKYNIPSLVDTIYQQDNLIRKSIIFTFIFTAWIYPLSHFLGVFIAVILSYHIIYHLTKLSLIYKNLK